MTRPKTTAKSTTTRKSRPIGCVAFVGAGPGDPELLTVRAVELLAKADVVVTESQDADFVRRFCRDDVEVVDGSLGDDGQPLSHAVRARLVVKAAKSGGIVVRLLDGDPFLYATGSEEAVGCAKAGIPFEVVPGVSSITAVPAYAGIPLTSAKHREVRVVNVAEGIRSSADWSSIAAGTATLVLLSATQVIGDVAKALIAAGRSPETPVAMTQLGTTTSQRTVTSTLERIAADVKAAKLAPPTITVVGDTVVAARDAVLVRDQAAVRLAGARAADQGAGRRAVRPAARLRRGARGGADHRGRAAAHPAADGAGHQGPGDRPLRVGRVHLAQRGQGRPRAVRGVRPGRPRVRRHQGGRRRRADRGRPARVGHQARPGAERRAVGRRPARGLAAVRRGLRPDRPGLPAAGRHRHREPGGRPGRARLGGRRRHGLPDRARRAAGRADPGGDQERRLRRGRLHVVLDGAQPGRHRGQAAHRPR